MVSRVVIVAVALVALGLKPQEAIGQGSLYHPHPSFYVLTGDATVFGVGSLFGDEALLFTPETSGNAVFAHSSSDSDATLKLYKESTGQLLATESQTDGATTLSFNLSSGTEYRLLVDGSFGSFDFTITLNLPAPSVATISPDSAGDASIPGTINPSTEGDYFKYTAPSSGLLTVEADSVGGVGWDTDLIVFNSLGLPIAINDGSGDNGNWSQGVTTGQVFYFLVRGDLLDEGSDSTGSYTLYISGPGQPNITPPSVPILVAPPNGFETSDSTVFLDWNPSTDAGSGVAQYQLQMDNSSSFTSPAIDLLMSGTSHTTPSLADTLYYWHVRAQDSAGNWSNWSATWSFRVDTTPPSVPVLLAPPNGSPTLDATPTFDWANSTDSGSGVKNYDIEIYDGNVSWGDISETVVPSTYTPASPIPPDTVFWKVRARDDVGNVSQWSTTWSLDITQSEPLQLASADSQSYVSPTVPLAGQTVAINYTIVNPNPFSVDVCLGCSIHLAGPAYEGVSSPTQWISDPAHDTDVSVPSGTHVRTRQFTIPSNALAGPYTVAYSIRPAPGGTCDFGLPPWDTEIQYDAPDWDAPAPSTELHVRRPTFGTTVLTHGYSPGDKGAWVEDMARAIVARAGAGSIFRYDPASGHWTFVDGTSTSSQERVLIFAWNEDSDELNTPGLAEAAADALYAALRNPSGDLEPFDLLANGLHFIGHSRGTVVNSEVVQRLGQAEIPSLHHVDRFTMLDPHPLDKDHLLRGTTDPMPTVWTNIEWADNYYQGDAYPEGMFISGAHNHPDLTSVLIGRFCLDHALVHDWYHYTIDLDNMSLPCFSNRFLWYGSALGADLGYFHSVVVGGSTLPEDCPSCQVDPMSEAVDSFFNGSFVHEDEGTGPDFAGWDWHGGGGTGTLDSDGGDGYLVFNGGEWRRHNRFFITSLQESVQFWYRLPSSSWPNDRLLVRFHAEDGDIPDSTTSLTLTGSVGSWHPKQVSIPNGFKGRTCTLQFEHQVQDTDGNDGPVHIDDITLAAAPSAPPSPPDPVLCAPASCTGAVLCWQSGAVPPAGVTWYWQGIECGTLTTLGSGPTYAVSAAGTFHLRARDDASGLWSGACGDIPVTLPLDAPEISPIDDLTYGPCGGTYQSPLPTLANPICAGSVTWSLELPHPAGMIISPSTGQVSWPSSDAGTYAIGIKASGGGGTDVEEWLLIVTPSIPIIAGIPDVTVPCGVQYVGQAPVTINPPCMPVDYWQLESGPRGMSIDSPTGVVTWLPMTAGTYGVTIKAINSTSTDTESWTLIVSGCPAKTYVGPAGGSWFEASHWSSGEVPDSRIDVEIPVQVVIDQRGAAAGGVTIGGGGELVVGAGSLTAQSMLVESGGRLTLSTPQAQVQVGSLTMHAGSVLTWSGGSLVVVGTASIDGSLVIEPSNQFEVVCGESISVLTALLVTGVFDSVETPDLPPDQCHLQWSVDYQETSVIVFVGPSLSTDLDCDGDTDAFDLGMLLGAFGEPCSCCPADLDGDNDVDGFDLGILLGAFK